MHQRDPDQRPDHEFEAATLHHLMPGTEGRLTDPRRTPIRLTEVRPAVGMFELEITGFEDAGARWLLPLESFGVLQVARGSPTRGEVRSLQAAIERFDQPLSIAKTGEPPPLSGLREAARPYARGREVDTSGSRGSPEAWAGLRGFMDTLGLWDVEDAFARQFVSNPYSGELIKGHRIVMAELGLAAYQGKVVRDPATFEGPWSRARRRRHILARLAFVRELFEGADLRSVVLWRGLSTAGRLQPPRNLTFVSASFDRQVAESLFAGGDDTQVALLMRQRVPVSRLFMTYVETEAMNQHYLEAEAVLFHEEGNLAF